VVYAEALDASCIRLALYAVKSEAPPGIDFKTGFHVVSLSSITQVPPYVEPVALKDPSAIHFLTPASKD
jgi:hypothetical protein